MYPNGSSGLLLLLYVKKKKKITNIAFNCLTPEQRRQRRKKLCNTLSFPHALPLLYPSDGEVKVQFCKSAREIKVLACYNDCHPPTNLFPVEGHHRQSVSKKSQDSLINLLTVAEGNKDRYCRRGGSETELQHGYTVCSSGESEKKTSYDGGGGGGGVCGWRKWLRSVFVVTPARWSLWNDKAPPLNGCFAAAPPPPALPPSSSLCVTKYSVCLTGW